MIEVGTHGGTASNAQTEGFLVIQDRNVLANLENMVIETLWNRMKLLGNPFGRRLMRIRYGKDVARQAIGYFERFKEVRGADESRNAVFRGAPAVIVIHGLRSNRNVHENCAVAARNMEVMALSLGLGTCWAGLLLVAAGLTNRIAGSLGIPPSRNIYSALMLGYPKHRYRKSVPRRQRDVRWL